MGALSIASVTAEAHKINPNLTLVRKADHFEWRLGDKIQRVEVNQIRGLKMDEWLRFARVLATGQVISATPVLPLPAAPVEKKDFGPMPAFMIISKNGREAVPFDPDPEVQGYKDAQRGFTACPYGLEDQRRKWDRGHDRAFNEGLADKPRFGRTAERRN